MARADRMDGGARWRPSALVAASVLVHVAALLALIALPGWWPQILAMLVLNHAVLTACGLLPRCHWLGPNMTRLPAAAAARREIAITIDDGPDPQVTPAVLDLLDRHGARATFFCIGTRVRQHAGLCREIVRRGHAVENHSQHHRHNFAFLGPAAFRRELQAAQDTLTETTGVRPRFFRAPAGLRNPMLDPVLCGLGLRLASWTRRGFDTRTGDPDLVLRRLVQNLCAGDILLLHDGNSARVEGGQPVILEVLPKLLEAAGANGLHCVTLQAAHA